MRALLKLLSAASLVAALGAVPQIVQAGGVLRLDEVAVGELDPAKASDYADSILMFNVYDTLVIPQQGAPGHDPHLAASWSGEGTSFTFTLRDDVKFQSGNPLTADDVVFSLDRMKTIGHGLSYLFVSVEGAEALDAHTVRFDLSEPYAPFVSSLVRLPIVDKQLVMANLGEGEGEMGDWGQAFLSQNGGGSGAYRVVSHNPQDETVMEKSADYFLPIAEAAPDTVRLRYGLEAATVRTLIAQGEHDISSQWVPPEVLRALSEGGAQLLTEGGVTGFYMKLNTTKPPLDDVHCRLALAKAFDYEGGIKIIAVTDEVSQGTLSTGAIPAAMLGANPREKAQTRDLDAGAAASGRLPLFAGRLHPAAHLDRRGAAGRTLRAPHAGELLGDRHQLRNQAGAVGALRRAGIERRDLAARLAGLRHRGDRRFRYAALRHVPLQRGRDVAIARAPE